MSAISLILLCAAAVATALGGAALHTARGLRRQLTALRAELEPTTAAAGTVPHARTAPGSQEHGGTESGGTESGEAEEGAFERQIRAAVAAALADERERELAEARAFWAAQEARDAGPGSGALLAGHGTEYEVAPSDLDDGFPHLPDASRTGTALPDASLTDYPFADTALPDAPLTDTGLPDSGPTGPGDETAGTPGAGDRAAGHRPPTGSETGELFIPRQPGPEDGDVDVEVDVAPYQGAGSEPGTGSGEEPPDLAAARRRHPSQPDYNLKGEPVTPQAAPSPAPTVTYHERTIERLAQLADARTPLADVRPGPLGTLDLYLFEDGTTVCLSPGDRVTSEALADAVRRGEPPVLMGGSGIAGSYTLTFAYPDGSTAYLLADRVITPL
ncbi:hypothetical protein FM076_13305 [Streptomyces albus subsp. chlorinus]|nr:hypothetical protein [Streptomyces albus subsp. chlorinus]